MIQDSKKVKKFERSRDELEKEYHWIIEEFLKRQWEEKKEESKTDEKKDETKQKEKRKE